MKCKKCGNESEFLFYLERCVEVSCEEGKPTDAETGSEELTEIVFRECHSEDILASNDDRELFWEIY